MTIRTFSSTSARTRKSSAPTARRSIASTQSLICMWRARLSARCLYLPPPKPALGIPTMAQPRHVIIAGAGIAGLTAALALARAGIRVTVYEQTGKLEETGAGVQLSPNGSRVLIALGLRERLESVAVAPDRKSTRLNSSHLGIS